MSYRVFRLSLLLAFWAGLAARAQEAQVRVVGEVTMPVGIDSNSPSFWRDGQLNWFGSQGRPRLNVGASQFGPWDTYEISFPTFDVCPHWLESVWHDDQERVLWGWYHAEPVGLVPGTTLTAPKIGAVVSFDGGRSLTDLGSVLESGDELDPNARNGYFAGGHGDFSVILNQRQTYFYFFFDNYGGLAETQGVCVARMAFEDRFNPLGRVWKYCEGQWQEAGIRGRVTPIMPVTNAWQRKDPDAFWGPSVHWNTYLNCYVMLLNRAKGEPGWAQEGIYVSFCSELSKPETWTTPVKILDNSKFPGWYFFYPQVMGLGAGETDTRAGQTVRLYVGGISRWEIDFVRASDLAPGATTPGNAGDAVTVPPEDRLGEKR